ncbi:MAG TPA: hypothetical protein PKM35_02905 [Holophaga sp.]|nr:hypothetical protein [Holophaga sp.]HPS68362.1 hypothetical protein [Holophaga sp.]
MVTRETQVEELLRTPGLIAWFIQRGVSPFSCYGAFPDTLGRLLELKRVPDPDAFIRELNVFLDG